MEFTIHDENSAPEASRPILEQARKGYGMLPNLLGVFAEAPATLQAYLGLMQNFKDSSFSDEERHVIWLAINYYHDCHYCMPAHSALALKDGVSQPTVDALRDGKPLPDSKLQALRQFTVTMVDKRGMVNDEDLKAFADAGYGQQQVLEVLIGIAHKTLSNYTNHMAQTPVDDAFAPFTWKKSA